MTKPPLPEPNVEMISGHREPFIFYDKEQLLAYRAEVIEMCAKELDEITPAPTRCLIGA